MNNIYVVEWKIKMYILHIHNFLFMQYVYFKVC